MLTNTDLSKIGSLVDKKLDAKLDEKLAPIKKSLRKLGADQKIILNGLGRDIINVRTRVDRIEQHLGFANL